MINQGTGVPVWSISVDQSGHRGASLEYQLKEGWTPLRTTAFIGGRFEIVLLLVDKGANLERQDKLLEGPFCELPPQIRLFGDS